MCIRDRITGGNGFIASLVKEAMQSSMEIIPLTRKELDLGDTAAVRSWFNTHDYDYVFHTGAMAQTADCEKMCIRDRSSCSPIILQAVSLSFAKVSAFA